MVRTTAPQPGVARSTTAPRELDSRTTDGIQVQLLWYPHDGHVSVAVSDSKTAKTFELEVRDRDHALDVFHHPYAYAAETREVERVAARSAY